MSVPDSDRLLLGRSNRSYRLHARTSPLRANAKPSPHAVVSLRPCPVFVWRPEVGELGEEVLVWPHPVLCHPPVRQEGHKRIGYIVGKQTTVVRVGNRSRGVVGQDIR